MAPASDPHDPTREVTTEVASLASLIALLLEPDPSARPCHADWVARALEQVRARFGATRTTTLRDPATVVNQQEGTGEPSIWIC